MALRHGWRTRRLRLVMDGRVRFPLAWLLLAGFALVVVLSVGTVSLSTVGALRANTIDLTRDKAELTLTLVNDHLYSSLDPAEGQLRHLNDAIQKEGFDPLGGPRFPELAAAVLSGAPHVTSIGYVAADTRVVRITRAGQRQTRTYYETAAARVFDASWREALSETGPYWGGIIWTEVNLPIINVRHPVRRDGRMVGVLFASFSVADLSNALRDVADEFGARVFILVDRDQVLAHPVFTRDLSFFNASQQLPRISDVGDPILADMWNNRARIDRDLLGGRGHLAWIGKDAYVYVYREIQRYGGRPWLIGTYMREPTLTEALSRVWQSLALGLGVMLLGVAAAVLIARAVTRRMREFAAASRKIQRLRFKDVHPIGDSRLREFYEAGRAFNAMLDGLKLFEAYAPRTLVRRLLRLGAVAAASQNRELAIMFTDIADFTSQSERLSAGEVAAFVNHHFALLEPAIDAEAGLIDKFMGDGLMAFWGAPDDAPDGAARAARAALVIRSAVEADNAARRARGLAPVQVRIALHFGPVTVGNIGARDRMNYTIVGDPVNTASRICELASDLFESDQSVAILASEDFAKACGLGFTWASVGSFSVRGRAESVELKRLLDLHREIEAAQ